MQTLSQVGILLIDAQNLKEIFLPSPKRCYDDINRCIPQLSHSKNKALMEQITTATRALTSDPKTVEHFVDHLGILQDINQRQEELQMKFKAVMDLNQLMAEFKVKVPDEEHALFQTLSPAYTQLREVMAQSELNKEASKPSPFFPLPFFFFFFFFFCSSMMTK